MWQNGRMTDLGALGGSGSYSSAVAINERGQAVGSSQGAFAFEHGFLWEKGRMTDLGELGSGTGSGTTAINDRGQIIGWSAWKLSESGMPGEYNHSVLWQNGLIRDLGTLAAAAINERGQIVGSSNTHAAVWEKGKTTDLGTLPGRPQSNAAAINERDQIVGWSATKTGQHAVLWTLRSG